jgi:hypothetical protein
MIWGSLVDAVFFLVPVCPSLVWCGAFPGSRTVAQSTTIRFVCFEGPGGRRCQVFDEANRLHRALEDTGIKFDCVASDILGACGRAMLDALVAVGL